jgi:hypothetical protein
MLFSADCAALETLTGLTVEEFRSLLGELAPRLTRADRARLQRPERRRAPGAGRPLRLALADQVALTLLWCRQRPTTWFLGLLFDVGAMTVWRTRRRVLPLLLQLAPCCPPLQRALAPVPVAELSRYLDGFRRLAEIRFRALWGWCEPDLTLLYAVRGLWRDIKERLRLVPPERFAPPA